MATTLKFLPGSTIRWRATRFIVVDYADIDAIIARELGKRKLERIPVRDAKPEQDSSPRKIRRIVGIWIRIPSFVNITANSFGANKPRLGTNAIGGSSTIIKPLRRRCRIALGRWNHCS